MCKKREENNDKYEKPTEARWGLTKGCPERGAGSVPHDRGARNRDKLLRLRMRHGAAGYGVYFMLLERLTEESGHMSVKDYNMVAFDLRVDAALVKSVVEDFGLFAFAGDGKCFHSEGLDRRLAAMRETETGPILTAGKKKAKKNPQNTIQATAREKTPAEGRACGNETDAGQDGRGMKTAGSGIQKTDVEEPSGNSGITPCAQKEKDKEKENSPFLSPLPPLSSLSPLSPTPPITLNPTYPSISSIFSPKEKDKEKERPDDGDDESETRTHAREAHTHEAGSPAGEGTEGRRVRVEGFAAGNRQETPAGNSTADGGRPTRNGSPATSPQGIQPAGHGGCGHGSGGDPYAGFLRAFFDGHQAAAESLCMQLHTDMDALRQCAERVVDEWRLADARHDGYTDAARHLISQLRIKVRDEAAHGEIPTRGNYYRNDKNNNGNGTIHTGGGRFETCAERNARLVAERNRDIDEYERRMWQGVASSMRR